MRPLRRGRWAFVAGVILLLFVVAIPLATEIVAASHVATLPSLPDSITYRVFVADWGYHTSIIVERPPGMRLGPPGREDAPFVEYAWGDRRFYMESNHSPPAALAALFWPTSSVTYVEAWAAPPNVRTNARELLVRDVSAGELRRLLASLEGSMRRTTAGARDSAYPPARGYVGRFYSSLDFYIWTRDCNRWTVDRLAAAGLAHRGFGVLFSGQVSGRLTGFRAVIARQH